MHDRRELFFENEKCLQEVCLHVAFALNFDIGGFAVVYGRARLKPCVFAYMNAHRFSGAFHTACNINGVAPDIVNEF